MDEKEFKRRVEQLEKIGNILEKLPAEIRSDAFNFLKDAIAERSSISSAKNVPGKTKAESIESTEEEFFRKFDLKKPADNANLIAAYFYREYGTEPFTAEEVRQKASEIGITIPTRPDNTFRYATEKTKKLFALAGKGTFKPTVHGEAYLKETYGVNKGTKKRPVESK